MSVYGCQSPRGLFKFWFAAATAEMIPAAALRWCAHSYALAYQDQTVGCHDMISGDNYTAIVLDSGGAKALQTKYVRLWQ